MYLEWQLDITKEIVLEACIKEETGSLYHSYVFTVQMSFLQVMIPHKKRCLIALQWTLSSV